MKTAFLRKATNWILRFMQVQLVVTLISLPILASWGFPISMLSPIGNLAFTPVFIVFLLISSLIFFFEILYIPNNFLIYLLKIITNSWLYIIPDNNQQFLVGFTKPPFLFLVIVPIATFAILKVKKIDTVKKSILSLSLLFILSCLYLKTINKPKELIKHIACNKGEVTFIYHKNKTVLIDPGFIGQRISADSWVQYTLLPEITKSCGKTSIDHLIVMQPGKITFEAIQTLIKSLVIKNVYLIVWDGTMTKSAFRSFFMMRDEAKKNKTNLKRIGNYETTIFLSDTSTIVIKKRDKILKYHDATYNALRVTCNIDNQTFKIYSAKYKKKQKNKP